MMAARDKELEEELARRTALSAKLDSVGQDPRLRGLGGLNEREVMIAELIAEGMSNVEIERCLNMAGGWVRQCVAKVYKKLRRSDTR